MTAQFPLGASQTYNIGTEDLEPAPATLAGSVTFGGAAQVGFAVSLVDAAGAVVATTTTVAGGAFAFTGLAPGSYAVEYNPAASQVLASGPANSHTGLTALQTLSAGQTVTFANEDVEPGFAAIAGVVQISASGSAPAASSGTSVTLLNAAGAVVASTVTGSDGSYDFTGLTAGTYSVNFNPPGNTVLEFGSTANAATGSTAPLTVKAGQTLSLAPEQELTSPASISGPMTFLGGGYWKLQGFTVELLSASGAALGSAVTNSTGVFSFTGVASGTYQLLYQLPPNARFYGGYENPTTGLSGPLTVNAGQSFTWYNVGVQAIAGAVINGAVAYAPSAGGTAAPQAGVTVSLLNAYGTVVLTTTSNSAGVFQFRGMLQGNYQVLYSAPVGDSLASGGPANVASGLTGTIALGVGQTLTLGAETLLPSLTRSVVAGSVTYDGAADAGVPITLVNVSGATTATTTTTAAGTFQFNGLVPGSYQVQYSDGPHQVFASGPANAATGLTPLGALAAGQTVTLANEDIEAAPAAIAGVVQVSASGGTPAAALGTSVTLLNAAGAVMASTVTGSDGSYDFTGLTAGTYSVNFNPPGNTALEFGSTANAATGTTAPLTVTAGQTVTLPTEQELTSPASISGPMTFLGRRVLEAAGLHRHAAVRIGRHRGHCGHEQQGHVQLHQSRQRDIPAPLPIAAECAFLQRL